MEIKDDDAADLTETKTEPAYKLLGMLVEFSKAKADRSRELRQQIAAPLLKLTVKEQQSLASEAMQASMDATDGLAKAAELLYNIVGYAVNAPCTYDATKQTP
ncbi:MAG: hypothetical protein NVSMB5_26420 [Candidatus Velthaea sp.]